MKPIDLQELGLNPASMEAALGLNAARLFGIVS